MLCWLLLLVCRDYGAPGSVVPPEHQNRSFLSVQHTGLGLVVVLAGKGYRLDGRDRDSKLVVAALPAWYLHISDPAQLIQLQTSSAYD